MAAAILAYTAGMQTDHQTRSGGFAYAIAAYAVWGVAPIYLMLLMKVPPVELVGWRIIFTVPICLVIVVARRQVQAVRLALGHPRVLMTLLASAMLIATNWMTFVLAVQSGHVLAASVGYYVNPLVNVLFATIFLKERLSGLQWLAVLIAACGVALLAWGALDTLWISVSLALSFSSYGFLRKIVPVESLPGLTIETLLLLVPASGIVAWYGASAQGSALVNHPENAMWILGFGVLTATPLLLFAAAARRMDFTTLGFTQYLGPTLTLIVGLVVFGEPLRPAQAICFVLIWTAIAVFSFDLLQKRRRARTRD